MARSSLHDLLELQSGVVSRRQARELGLSDADVRRLVRRREWATVSPGVYVAHTGPLTWVQRAWAAVLAAWPAALCADSALRAADGPGRHDRHDAEGVIHVAVGSDRSVLAPAGVAVHRLAAFDTQVRWNTSPPRMRIEDAVLDVAAVAHDDMATIAILAGAVQSRRTSADRILAALDGRSRIARRALMRSVLRDIAHGTCSALEHGYLTRVERPHGLPRPDRQFAPADATVLRDVDYGEYGLVIELDGRLFHDNAVARDADLERDLDAKLLSARETVRLGWGQVMRRSCSTADKVGRLLSSRGWAGRLRRCPRCPRADSGGSQSPGDWDPPLSA